MDMLDILRKYIRAERTGNWALHLQAIQEMLPYLAASDHNLYAKSARVGLQQMSNLKTQHPNVQQRFDEDSMWFDKVIACGQVFHLT